MQIRANEIKLVSLDDIKLNPRNRNKHPKDQIDRLVDIISYQGFRNPLIISNRSGHCVAGEGRYLAAKKLKLKQVPVIFQDFDSDEQEIAAGVSDNAIGLWSELDLSGINTDIPDLGPDFDIDLLGIKNFMIDVAEKEGLTDPDDVPEPPKEPKTVLGDIYELGGHRLLCGDSTQIDSVERLMNDQKADMVFTDPPYGINEKTDRAYAAPSRISKGGTFRKIIGDETIDAAVDCWNLIQGLSPRLQIWWGANHYSNKINGSPSWIVWDKRVEEKEHDFNSDCELAWCSGFNKSVRIFRHKWKGLIKASEHGEKRVHPTQKPIALAEWCFENYGDPVSVIDLFLGSGSTLIACEKTNRRCFGMELDPRYCDTIVTRWVRFTGQTKIKRNGEEIEWVTEDASTNSPKL